MAGDEAELISGDLLVYQFEQDDDEDGDDENDGKQDPRHTSFASPLQAYAYLSNSMMVQIRRLRRRQAVGDSHAASNETVGQVRVHNDATYDALAQVVAQRYKQQKFRVLSLLRAWHGSANDLSFVSCRDIILISQEKPFSCPNGVCVCVCVQATRTEARRGFIFTFHCIQPVDPTPTAAATAVVAMGQDLPEYHCSPHCLQRWTITWRCNAPSAGRR